MGSHPKLSNPEPSIRQAHNLTRVITLCTAGGARTTVATSSRLTFENNYLTEMCSGSEAGSYVRLIDFVYHSTLGLRVMKKKKADVARRGGRHETLTPSTIIFVYEYAW